MQNNEEHKQNEGPIHLAFLHVSAFSENAKSERPGWNIRAFWRHLVDLGSRFGAHWILKGTQHRRPIPHKNNISYLKKWRPGAVPEKHEIRMES